MTLLGRSVLRAARRPRALGLVWATRLLFAWIVASPLARTLSAEGTSRLPRGDALLFEPGGLYLAEAVRLSLPALGSQVVGALLVLSVLAWLSLLPHATLLAELEATESSLARSAGRAVALMPRLTLLAGLTLFAQAVILSAGLVAAAALKKRLALGADERLSDLVPLAVVALFALFALALGVVQDVARAALVSEARTALGSLGRALSIVRRRALSVFGAWSLGAGAALAAALGAAWVAGVLDVSRPGEWRVAAVFVVHQLAMLVVAFARSSWLAAAIELDRVSPRPPASAGTPADSAAPLGPRPDPAA